MRPPRPTESVWSFVRFVLWALRLACPIDLLLNT
jgi:hypothetical protein